MGKRSQRLSVRYEKDQSGCMRGLISMFDFRHGRSARKLLPDRRHGSKHFGSGLFKNKFESLSNLDETGQVATLDGEETTRIKVKIETGKSSVKKLIEEEMSNEKSKMNNASNFDVERIRSESAHDNQIRRDHKGTKKTRKKSCDMDAFDSNVAEKLQSECSCDQTTSQQSAKNIGLDEIIRELCHKIHLESNQCMDLNGEVDYKHYDIHEKLCKAMKDFINQKLINGKDDTEDHKIQNSRELRNVLELINSDEKVFLKLLQDPNSFLVEYVRYLHEDHAKKGEENEFGADLSEQKLVKLRKSEDVINDKHRHFFQRNIKSQEVKSSKANGFSDVSNRIVILKPRPIESQYSGSESNLASSAASISSVRSKGSSDRVGLGSHFFLSEIKRKLKYAIGKQQNEVPSSEISDGVGNNNPGKRSPGKEHFYIERIAKPSVVSKRSNKKGRTKGSGMITKNEIDKVSNQKISTVYIEAKKHLSEMVSSGDDVLEPSSRQVSKRLGRILSLSDYSSSPIGSPRRSWENSFVTAKMRFSAIDKLKQVNGNMWSPKHEYSGSLLDQEAQNSKSESPVSDNNPNYTAEAPNINTSLQDDIIGNIEVEENVCQSKDERNFAGFVKEETFVTIASGDPSACSSPRDEQNCDASKLTENNKYLEPLERKDSIDENQLLSSPLASPCSVIPKKIVDLGRSINIPERTSPVSVLEPLFTEEDISPSRTISQHDGTIIQPLHIQFEEAETSASDQTKCERSITEEKESVFECVKLVIQASGCNLDEFYSRWLSSNQLLDPSLVDEIQFFSDQLCCYLLFDCINEALEEVCQNYFGCTFVKTGIRPLPDMKSAILEISEIVHWHLLQLPLPHSLDQIATKDMARTGTWMDLRFDTEAIGFDLGEAILVDLLEDTILSHLSESPGSEHGLVLQLNGNE